MIAEIDGKTCYSEHEIKQEMKLIKRREAGIRRIEKKNSETADNLIAKKIEKICNLLPTNTNWFAAALDCHARKSKLSSLSKYKVQLDIEEHGIEHEFYGRIPVFTIHNTAGYVMIIVLKDENVITEYDYLVPAVVNNKLYWHSLPDILKPYADKLITQRKGK